MPYIVGSPNDNLWYYNGEIDELRIWNTARTQTEIQANMNNELSIETGLVASYQFNQGIANGNNAGETTLNDASGNGNNGTLNNFALNGTSSNWVNGVSLSPPCPTTNSFSPIWINSAYKAAGASDPHTYYWGLSHGNIVAKPMNGVGPYTYQWSSSEGYTIKNNTQKKARLWYPTGPQWVKVEITDVGSNCTIEDSVYIDWVDYTCNQPSIWYYELCNTVTGVSTCVQGAGNMVDSLLTGNYMLGPCGVPKRGSEVSNTVSTDLMFNAFPNPNDGNFSYTVSGMNNGEYSTELYDLKGRVLFRENFKSSTEFTTREVNLEGVAPGSYIMRVTVNDESVVQKVMIVN